MNEEARDEVPVVYSCVTDGYDAVAPAPASRCAFILFHDGSVEVPAGWKGVTLAVANLRGIHLNRYAKMMPHRLGLPSSRSLYVDGNIVFKHDPCKTIVDALEHNRFAAFGHPARDCAYVELREALRLGFIGPLKAWSHRRLFNRIGLPRRAGLIEANVLMRRHDDEGTRRLDEAWWSLWQRGLLRDQPLLMAAAQQCGVHPQSLGPTPIRAGTHPVFGIAPHRTKRTRQARIPNRLAAELSLFRLWAS